jgi:hypothetical protein
VADLTDAYNVRATAIADIADVLCLTGQQDEAAGVFAQAVELYEQKGNVVGAARTRDLRQELALV